MSGAVEKFFIFSAICHRLKRRRCKIRRGQVSNTGASATKTVAIMSLIQHFNDLVQKVSQTKVVIVYSGVDFRGDLCMPTIRNVDFPARAPLEEMVVVPLACPGARRRSSSRQRSSLRCCSSCVRKKERSSAWLSPSRAKRSATTCVNSSMRREVTSSCCWRSSRRRACAVLSPVSWSRARPRKIAAVDRPDSWLASEFGALCGGSAILYLDFHIFVVVSHCFYGNRSWIIPPQNGNLL